MPLPLKPGYHFNFDHTARSPHYEMAAAEAYTDFYGISYMLSGDRLIYSPGFTTIVQAGEMVFIPRNVYRRTTYISNTPYERIILKFTDSMIADLLDVIGIDKYNGLCEEHVIRFEKSTQMKICSILSEMEKEWNAYNDCSEIVLKGLLNNLIILVLRERIVGGVHVMKLEKRNDCLANAITYIKAHLRENPSLETTALNVNISPSYLSKIFINYLHTPYSTFVRNEKIMYAQRLLAGSRMSITEIAAEAGFSSNAYFSDCFRRNTGISPIQFRRENGNV